MPSIVRVAYFSPTHTTKTVAEEVAGALAAPLGASVEIVDLTLPGHRPADVSCGADDVLVFGFPVYAGRVPVLLRDEFAHLIGQDTPAATATSTTRCWKPPTCWASAGSTWWRRARSSASTR